MCLCIQYIYFFYALDNKVDCHKNKEKAYMAYMSLMEDYNNKSSVFVHFFMIRTVGEINYVVSQTEQPQQPPSLINDFLSINMLVLVQGRSA